MDQRLMDYVSVEVEELSCLVQCGVHAVWDLKWEEGWTILIRRKELPPYKEKTTYTLDHGLGSLWSRSYLGGSQLRCGMPICPRPVDSQRRLEVLDRTGTLFKEPGGFKHIKSAANTGAAATLEQGSTFDNKNSRTRFRGRFPWDWSRVQHIVDQGMHGFLCFSTHRLRRFYMVLYYHYVEPSWSR